MSENLLKCKDKLIFISSIKDRKLRVKLLNQMLDKCLLKAIREIIINAQHEKIKLNTYQKRGLVPYRKTLRLIAENKINDINKVKKQIGGFWHLLIPAAISALSLIK